MSSKPTLRDIAEATGVSTASVSMILNGKSLERFSSQRVASVLAEAERIGYRTPSARCAGKQIAVLSPSVSNPYHTKMITGIDAAAHAAGYHTAIYNTYWNPRTESHLLDSLDYSRVAGIIFAMTPIADGQGARAEPPRAHRRRRRPRHGLRHRHRGRR